MSTPITLGVGEFMPDMPAFQNPGSATVTNVTPLTPTSYGPFKSFSQEGNALTTRCQGAAAAIDSSGNITVFAGDSQDLWSYVPGVATPANISKSLHAYAIAADQRWVFTQFGQRVLATDFESPIQSFVLGVSAAFADLAGTGTPPKARYLAPVKGFLAVANTNDATFGLQPQRVWWSADNDPTNWPTPGTANAAQFQSSYNDLFGEGGWIQGIVGNLGTADGAVFMEHAVWRMVYVGPPVVFDFLPAEGVRGTPAPGSIVQLGALVYYLGEDGFYIFDGTSSRPIGANKVDRFFYDHVDTSNMHRIVGAIDPVHKLVIWAVPFTGNTGGNPDTLLVYNWQLDRWSLVQVTVETIFRALTFGVTLDQLFTQLGFTIDNLPFGLDSRAWTGGNPILCAFDTTHSFGCFEGANLAPIVETTELQAFPGYRAFVRNSRALVDGGVPSVAISRRDRLVDAPVYAPPSKMNALGTSPQRLSGRYLRARITLPAASNFTHIQGVEVEGTRSSCR